ncbi:MAG: hypothetical protein ABSH25_07890 [Syntrophorhabdales bacterium]|jgi:hypothetical protein
MKNGTEKLLQTYCPLLKTPWVVLLKRLDTALFCPYSDAARFRGRTALRNQNGERIGT